MEVKNRFANLETNCMAEASRSKKYVVPFQVEGRRTDEVGTFLTSLRVAACGIPRSHRLQAAWLFRLVLDNGWFLDISSSTTGVGGWQEVGSLTLKFMSAEAINGYAIDWAMTPLEDFQIESVECLFFEDAEVFVASGMVLRSSVQEEITVVAGPAPGSVSVALPSSTSCLQGEFDIEELQRRRLS